MNCVTFHPKSKLVVWKGLLMYCCEITKDLDTLVTFEVRKQNSGRQATGLMVITYHELPGEFIGRYRFAERVGVEPIRRIQRWRRLMLARPHQKLAFAMGLHARLGPKPLVFALDEELLRLILMGQ
jgi:hypothetical protein